MLKEIMESFNKYKPYLETQVRQRYGLKNELKQLRGPVYECEEKIFKLTHKKKRSTEYLMGVVDFIKYLKDHGVVTPSIVTSNNDTDIEKVEVDDSYFNIVAFEKAKGKLPTIGEWDKLLFQKWGQTMGRIHFLTKRFNHHKHLNSSQWDAREIHALDKYIPGDQEVVLSNSFKLLDRLRSIPKDAASYGFIHSDFHHKNFFIHNGEINLFDFDDAIYNWFIADISTSLFYGDRWSLRSDHNYMTPQTFLYNFLNGYSRENQIDAQMIKYIPEFLKYEQLRIYTHFYKYIHLTKPDQETIQQFQVLKENIENETPVFGLDIDTVIE